MAIFYGTQSTGADFIEASVLLGSITYEPVSAEKSDLSFIYKILPSFYRNLMVEQKSFSSLWSAVAQVLSGDLLSAWHSDYSISAKDILTYNQRKWYKFNFLKLSTFLRLQI